MTVQDIVSQLYLTVCSGQEGLQREVKGGYTSDLLSDVMGHAQEGDVWVTLQTHKNVMAIASLKEIAAIILVKGHLPEEDTLEALQALIGPRAVGEAALPSAGGFPYENLHDYYLRA